MVPLASDFLSVTTSVFLCRRSLYFYYTVYTQEVVFFLLEYRASVSWGDEIIFADDGRLPLMRQQILPSAT